MAPRAGCWSPTALRVPDIVEATLLTFSELMAAIFLGTGALGLIHAVSSVRRRSRVVGLTVLVAAWLSAVGAWLIGDRLLDLSFWMLALVAMIGGAVLGGTVLLALCATWMPRMWVDESPRPEAIVWRRRRLGTAVMMSVMLVIAAWTPFLLWATGDIAQYNEAVIMALVLSAVVVLGGLLLTFIPEGVAGD